MFPKGGVRGYIFLRSRVSLRAVKADVIGGTLIAAFLLLGVIEYFFIDETTYQIQNAVAVVVLAIIVSLTIRFALGRRNVNRKEHSSP
ncbi:MAG: hypothetical protein HY296_04525 [Thaumarchaeota archaeon]|nr:hypothetical protein [Nitrososphaerota archaeon]